ncbi:hypothetical protein CCR75_004569 [Bremia lactucae]|uniref:Fibronectin type-III domain-containing protein n=1 Tax=Bremia lactucae TaxID=4779 RepID=A0A976IIQ8_BRELC|nr:hypothetical protein CCR75_004569 [Bremia lactucae]
MRKKVSTNKYRYMTIERTSELMHSRYYRPSLSVRYRSSSSSSLSVSACSNSSAVSSYPAPCSSASHCWYWGPDECHEDYEGYVYFNALTESQQVNVVFTEDKLGLTLRSQEQIDPLGTRTSLTIVKSTIFGVGQVSHQICEGDVLQFVNGESIANLKFQDVLRILKIAPRPIRLRFRTKSTRYLMRRAWSVSGDEQYEMVSRRSSMSSLDSDQRTPFSRGVLLFSDRLNTNVDRNDSESHDAVMSESFGDVDSRQSTETSSVFADLLDAELSFRRQSSRLAAFLRKPFRRTDSFDGRRLEVRMGIVSPPSPWTEIAVASFSKAAIHVRWRVHSNAISYHVQFSRDWTMKVWKNWSGHLRPSQDRARELVTTIVGLDFSKTYVVRVRYEFRRGYGLGEWSSPSLPITTISQEEAMQYRMI